MDRIHHATSTGTCHYSTQC